MEKSNTFEEYLGCNICLEMAEDAVETQCCHNVFCGACISACAARNSDCPLCRVSPVSWSPSIFVRQVVAEKQTPCAYGCGALVRKSEQKAHDDECSKRVYKCGYNGCDFASTKPEFVDHILENHEAAVFEKFDTQYFKQNSTASDEKRKLKLDLVNGMKNSKGDQAFLGSTGKFYCGKTLDIIHCKCCNGKCGPTDGCNCSACMKLDVALRSLPKGYLVNISGRISRYDSRLQVFCCNQDVEEEPRCEVMNQCYACQRLQKTKARYMDLL